MATKRRNETSCIKCGRIQIGEDADDNGNRNIDDFWCSGGDECSNPDKDTEFDGREHRHFKCRCGFEWLEPCLDAGKARKSEK